MTESDPIVRARNVGVSPGRRRVPDGLSFELARGEALAVLGASGTGKSTLLRLIQALLEPDEGELWVKGRPLTDCSYEEILTLGRDIGMVFQGSALFDSMTVRENVAFPLREYTQCPMEEILERVREVLRFVDLLQRGRLVFVGTPDQMRASGNDYVREFLGKTTL